MSEWVEKPLGQLASFKKGKKVDTSDLPLDGYVPYLGASSLTGGSDGWAKPQGGIDCLSDDALMLWDGERSGLVGSGRDGVISSTVMRLRPESDLSGAYLVHLLRQNFDWIQARRTGTGVPHVPKDLGRMLQLPYPKNKVEQATICGVLDCLDNQIAATEALVAKKERLRAGLMQDLFTRGVDENGELRPPREVVPSLYHETELGWLPKGWTAPLLDSASKRVSGHTPNRLKSEYWNGGIKWVSLADSAALDNLFIEETKHEISLLGIENSSAQLLPKGTVIVSRDAGVGKSGILAGEMAVSQHFIGWVCSSQISNLFLYYYLQASKRMFENIALGSTIVTIGLPFFKRMRIPLPGKAEEQRAIAQTMLSIDEGLTIGRGNLEKLKRAKAGLMQDLLTGTVSVEPLLDDVRA